jgi:choice-of-anchor A domain-containing protein
MKRMVFGMLLVSSLAWTSDMISAAQRIMVYYYGTSRVFIQSDFAGTIVAPNAEVVVGQSGKNFYGAIYAKSIVIHQNTRITWVPFVSQQNNSVVAYATDLNYSINFLEI